MIRPKTRTEELAERTARANRIRRELGTSVGSPYRINEAIESKDGKPKPNREPFNPLDYEDPAERQSESYRLS